MRRLQSVRTRTNALKSVLGYAGSTSEVKCCCRVFRSSGVLRREFEGAAQSCCLGAVERSPSRFQTERNPYVPQSGCKGTMPRSTILFLRSGRPH